MIEELRIGDNGFRPTVRSLASMRKVVYDTAWLREAPNRAQYWFYRGVYSAERDREVMGRHGLRYDVTVIPPRSLGVEFNKTLGHYHPRVPGGNVTYPELYQVQSGSALYLLQKEDDAHLTDVILVEAHAGDVVLIPPDYGHITINGSEDTLRMCNWVHVGFSSTYEPILKRSGGAYYKLTDGRLVRNSSYGTTPQPRFGQMNLQQYFRIDAGMYEMVTRLDELAFLSDPEGRGCPGANEIPWATAV